MTYNRSGSVPYKANGNVPVSIEEGGVTLTTTDIEVGGVEIKDGTSDNGASVSVGGAVKVDGSAVTQPVSISGTMPVSGSVSVSNFPATQPVSGTVAVSTALALDATLTGGAQKSKLVDTAGANVASVSAGGALKVDNSAVTQPVSGTFFQATQPVSGTVTAAQATAANLNATVTQQALTKGTQGANGVTTQDLKDAGRTRVTIGFQAVAPATADTLLSLVKTSAGVAAGGATSIAVAANKTLRITAITLSLKANAAAAAFGTLTLRSNPSGATVLGSQSELRVDVGNTEAVVGASRAVTVPIPDGIEFSGTQTIGVSLAAQAITNVISIALTGFEY